MKKNFLKKLVTGVLAATLGVTALAGCGSAKTADKGDQVYRTLDLLYLQRSFFYVLLPAGR